MIQKQPYGPEIDWWALGIIAYEIIFREVPFSVENNNVDLLYSLFASDYLTREEFDNKYLAFIHTQIEAILSTPQKKGDNDGKKN